MRKNVFFSFVIKAWSALVSFLIVPITLKCLGEYNNAVWLTISSMLIWIDNFDIGFGNGLRNKLAANLAHGDTKRAQETVSTTVVMLILIIIPAAALLITLACQADVYHFFNFNPAIVDNLRMVLTIAIVLVSSTFILKFIGNVYLGLQLPAVNNLLVTAGQTLALLGTIAVYLSGSHSLALIAAVNTGSPLVVWLAAYPYTFMRKYPQLKPKITLFRRDIVAELFNLGVKFFLIQIFGGLIFFTSSILISKLLRPEDVNPYQLAYKYMSIALLVFTIISIPYWSATTDAFERKDYEWIRKSRREMNKVLLVIVGMLIAMVAVSPLFYKLWLPQTEFVIPLSLTILIAIYMATIIASLSYSYFLNGMGALNLQIVCTVCAAIAFIPLTYLATRLHPSLLSIVAVMILVNLPGLIVNRIQFGKIISGTAEGLWKCC